jgi:hypothetical protein
MGRCPRSTGQVAPGQIYRQDDGPAGWKKLEADLRAGKVAKVVVWRLDRLGRTAKGLTALFADLQSRRVGLARRRGGE